MSAAGLGYFTGTFTPTTKNIIKIELKFTDNSLKSLIKMK